LADKFPTLRLVLLGPLEEGDALDDHTRRCLETHAHIIRAGEVLDTAPYYPLMDILALPSHREGFPNVLLEAQAAGRPVVAARATGIGDAIVDGENGLLFPVGDVTALTAALCRLLQDRVLANRLARAGQQVVKRDFQQELIWEALSAEY